MSQSDITYTPFPTDANAIGNVAEEDDPADYIGPPEPYPPAPVTIFGVSEETVFSYDGLW